MVRGNLIMISNQAYTVLNDSALFLFFALDYPLKNYQLSITYAAPVKYQ